MKEEYYQIGEVSRITGISKDTLHFYIKIGLISVSKLLLKMSPPVMLALLIQSIYNIADSFFVARYSTEGLTALSIIYPVQLLIILHWQQGQVQKSIF